MILVADQIYTLTRESGYVTLNRAGFIKIGVFQQGEIDSCGMDFKER